MDEKILEGTGIKVSRTLDEALRKIHAVHGGNLKTWLMPRGGNTLPKLGKTPVSNPFKNGIT
jgi:hypothetical protein